ncbi:MAG TPA: STAS/SEC14 domain-containing protein [Thermomicrobiales bacterium]|nr:STAS/SEC14 domain-containing protein [Thermomicrobiales bacterium]
MIEIISDVPEGTVGIRLSGEIDASAYKATIEPAVKAALANRDKINALVVVSDEGVNLTPGAMWEDAKVGLSHPRAWHRAALVAPEAWWSRLVPVMSALMPGELRTFAPDHLAEARTWLASGAG